MRRWWLPFLWRRDLGGDAHFGFVFRKNIGGGAEEEKKETPARELAAGEGTEENKQEEGK